VPVEVVFRQQEDSPAAVLELEPQEGHARIGLLQPLVTIAYFYDQDATRREVRIGVAEDPAHDVEPIATGPQSHVRLVQVLARECVHFRIADVGRIRDDQVVDGVAQRLEQIAQVQIQARADAMTPLPV